MGQKDLHEKILVAFDDVFADIINVLLFRGKCVIRPEDLEDRGSKSYYKDRGIVHELDRDVMKCWKKSKVRFACIGVENQTAADPDMVFRVIGYDGTAYRAQLNEKAEKGRYPVITVVLYFGYHSRWNEAVSLLEKIAVPEELEPYVNDYKINLFEVAYMSEEQVEMFQSDFRVVADYFVQKRKNKDYIPSKQKIKHIEAVLQLLSVMENDDRFVEARYRENEREAENMCDVLDRVEQRGIERGRTEERNEIMKLLYGNGLNVKDIARLLGRTEVDVKGVLQLV